MESADSWIPIIGYESYYINIKRRLVRNKKRQVLKPMHEKYIRLSREGMYHSFSLNKLIYAVLHSIGPDAISEQKLQVMECDDGLVLVTRQQIAAFANEKVKSMKASRVNVTEQYKKVLEFTSLMLQAIDDGDFSQVVRRMYDCEKSVKGYMVKNHNIRNSNLLNMHWENIIDIGITRLVNNQLPIYEPVSFLIGVASRYLKILVATKKNIPVEFNDNLLYNDSLNHYSPVIL